MSLINTSSRTLGSLEVGPLAFGTWRFVNLGLEPGRHLLETAVEVGATLVDCADVYGLDWGGTGFGMAEEAVGQVLAATPGLRDQIVLATKGGIDPGIPYDSSPDYLRDAVEASLRRLQTDVIDLYQIHRVDYFTDPAEVAGTLERLRTQGKIREVGVSNHSPAQFNALAAHLPFPIVSTQPQFSVQVLDPLRDGTLDLCQTRGVTPLAWSPLAGGRVPSGTELPTGLLTLLDQLADREGVDRSAIALAFLLAHPSGVVPILGTTNPERLHQAIRALTVQLDRTDCYAIIEASDGVPLP